MSDTNNLFSNFDLGQVKIESSKSKKMKAKKIELADDIVFDNSQLFSADGIETKAKVKATIKKINTATDPELSPEKILKSKKLSIQERLAFINATVLKVLGKQKYNVLVIKDKETFHNYITDCIATGQIAIDTETNNSLDPVTCKLMGPCFYSPGLKQAYVPVNHRNPETKERLSWQLTESDIREELQRIIDSKIMIIMHNGKFDYEVLKCTCDVKVAPNWDTFICSRVLNENEKASLKQQYISKIDPTQAKYDIEELFKDVAYADVDPAIFALYAATDSFMTYKLYEIQAKELEKAEYGPHLDLLGTHEIKGLRWLFHEVEMPIVLITAEMELAGVAVDQEFGARLQAKYNSQLTDIDTKISAILADIRTYIDVWRALPAANERTITYVPKKSKMTQEKIEQQYPEVDGDGNRFKYSKSKAEKLDEEINLASPSQLAILFYDVLGVKQSKTGRKTGKDELKSIKETLAGYLPKLEELETEFDEEELEEEVEEAEAVSADQEEVIKLGSAAKLADLILTRRGIAKLLTTYIEVIPDLAKHWPDGRIRFHMNSLGTDTGRYSSGGKIKYMENDAPVTVSGINIQNIPSHNPEIRLMFTAQTTAKLYETDENNSITVFEYEEVETTNGWKYPKDLTREDLIITDEGNCAVKHLLFNSETKQYRLEF